MAEIHIQRKRKNLWWLWLLIILVIVAVLYYLYINNYFDKSNLNVMQGLSLSLFAYGQTPQLS